MGRFKKGQSGNPAGRPKGFAGLAAEIRRRTDDGCELIELALTIARDKKAKHRDRIAALQWLADRGFGRPVQIIEIAAAIGPVLPSFDITALSIDEQRQLLALIHRAALPAADDDARGTHGSGTRAPARGSAAALPGDDGLDEVFADGLGDRLVLSPRLGASLS